MKQLKTLAIAFVLFISAQMSAQSKMAHIDVKTLITSMPEMKTAQAQLQKVQESYDAEYKTMVQEYQTKLDKYQKEAESGTVSNEINETRAKEIQGMGQRIQEFQKSATNQLQEKEIQLLKPIMEKAQAAIQKVATSKGVDYVLDASEGSGLLVAKGPDLLNDVKKELGF